MDGISEKTLTENLGFKLNRLTFPHPHDDAASALKLDLFCIALESRVCFELLPRQRRGLGPRLGKAADRVRLSIRCLDGRIMRI